MGRDPFKRDGTDLSWSAAALRALHPARLCLCLLALAVALPAAALILEAIGPSQEFQPELWWAHPRDRAKDIATSMRAARDWKAYAGFDLCAAWLGVVWCAVGGWIARAELLAQPTAGGAAAPSATSFFTRKFWSLVWIPLLILIASLLFIGVGLFAGLLNWVLSGVGAVVVSLLFPVFLLAAFIVTLILAGSASLPIMPAAAAAEGTDAFDAISRGFSYVYSQPQMYFGIEGMALAVSAAPFAAACVLIRPMNPYVSAAAAALSLSLFASFQSLVYLKMRRLVDGVEETKLWHGEDVTPGKPDEAPKVPAAAPDSPAVERGEVRFTFGNTLISGTLPLDLRKMALVFAPGLVWTTMAGAGGFVAAWKLAGTSRIEDGVAALARTRPAMTAAIAFASVIVAAAGMLPAAKAAARIAALELVHDFRLSLRLALAYARETRLRGFGSAMIFTIGVGLLCAAGGLSASGAWKATLLSGSAAFLSLGAGAFGLGAPAAERRSVALPRKGTLGNLMGNFPETLASGLANIPHALMCSLVVAGFAGLTWTIACECLSVAVGDRAQWVRWGLAGWRAPASQGPLFETATCIAGVWFALGLGLVFAYPFAYVISWGSAAYLRAREVTERIPAGRLDLTEEEAKAHVKDEEEHKESRVRKMLKDHGRM